MLEKDQVIFVLSNEEIEDDFISHGIWCCCKELRAFLPRREFPGKMLLAIGEYEGKILHLDGTPFKLPDDDEELFGDVDYRWFDNCYLATDKTGKRRFYSTRLRERIRIIDLYFQIKFPMSFGSVYR